MKRRQAARTEKTDLQALRLNISEVYGGMIPDRAKEDAALPVLAESIAKHGLLQPIVVQKNEEAGRYKLVCGARRLEACRMLGKSEIDAVLISGDRLDAAACFLEENLTHKPIHFLENAVLFAKPSILSRCVLMPQMAARYIRMLALDEQTRREIVGLSLEQAEPLLLISDAQQRLEAARTIAQRDLTPAQARRLVLPMIQERKMTGKRRAIRGIMEKLQKICDELNTQGIPTSLSVHAQNQGLCVQILLKKH